MPEGGFYYEKHKKGLFIAAAAALLASGLTAGVLASYQTSLDNVLAGQVQAKQFVFVEDTSSAADFTVKLAPGESQDYTITEVLG